MSRLGDILGRAFGGSRSDQGRPSVPPELEEMFVDALEDFRELLGLGRNRAKSGTKGETPKVLDFSTLMNQKFGAALFGKLAAETEMEVAKSEAAAAAKVQLVHCEGHIKTVRQLRARIDQLESELERARSSIQGGVDHRNSRLRDLLTEIVLAVGAGKPLTVGNISLGIARANFAFSPGPPYLVFPAPPPQPAESTAETAAPAPATAGQTSTTGAG